MIFQHTEVGLTYFIITPVGHLSGEMDGSTRRSTFEMFRNVEVYHAKQRYKNHSDR